MTGQQAAEMLGDTLRYTRRIVAKYRQEGAAGLARDNRGRTPVSKLNQPVDAEIVRMAQGEYRDYHDNRCSIGGDGQHSKAGV